MSPRHLTGLLLALGIGLCAAPTASAGLLVQADGIPGGSSPDKEHALWIEALSYSLSVTVPLTTSGGSPGAPVFSPLKMVLATDVSMPRLLAAHARQSIIPTITIDVTGPSGAQGQLPVLLKIKLTNARVQELTLDTTNSAAATTAVSFVYDGIDFEAPPPMPQGGGQRPASVKSGYTISTGTPR